MQLPQRLQGQHLMGACKINEKGQGKSEHGGTTAEVV